jgi:hypothetical protein
MRVIRRIGNYRAALGVMLALVVGAGGGCQSNGQRRVAASEPGLSGSVEGGSTVAAAPVPSSSMAWVDRHPLFSKPRDMYDTTNSNKVVKTAAAAVVGVPVGFIGELRQIVVGNPSGAKY